MRLFTDWNQIFRRTYSAVSTTNNDDQTAAAAQRLRHHPSQQQQRRFKTTARWTKTLRKSYVITIITGLSLLVAGLFILIFNPYEMIFQWKILLEEGGEIFEMWRKPPVDLYLRVYLFNVTNRDAFLAGREKMQVKEVGPYVYKELMSHNDVKFNDNGTITATPSHPLQWMPEMSAGDHETDLLVLPHIALLSIADVVSNTSYFTRLGLNLIIRQTKTMPLVQMTPKEFMFGYESTLMTLGYKFLPSWINFSKLGLIDRMYNFDGDFETVYTGANDITQSGLIDTYNGSPQMREWEGKCGYIRGASDGTKFASNLNPKTHVKFFRKSLCRPINLVMRNVTKASGLDGYVYRFPPNAMDNGYVDKSNQCFCKTKQCLPRGMLDVRQCYYGFPIALSYPHYLEADPKLLDAVNGTVPNRQKHESYFVINPKSGLPLDVAVRFQINMALGKISSIAHCERFEDMILPLLWIEIRLYSLPNDLAARFHMYLNILPILTNSMMIMLLILGVIFICIAFHKYMKKDRPNAYQVSWLDEEVETERMDKQLTQKAYKPGKKDSMSSKELEVYFNSLVTPLNQDIMESDYNEFGYAPLNNVMDASPTT